MIAYTQKLVLIPDVLIYFLLFLWKYNNFHSYDNNQTANPNQTYSLFPIAYKYFALIKSRFSMPLGCDLENIIQ